MGTTVNLPVNLPLDLSRVAEVDITSETGVFGVGYDQDNPPSLVRYKVPGSADAPLTAADVGAAESDLSNYSGTAEQLRTLSDSAKADLSNTGSVIVAQASDAGIRSAAAAVQAQGGGTVLIPAGVIPLLSPLPLLPGVIYQGAGVSWDSLTANLIHEEVGTILTGDGTFNGIEGNHIDNPDTTPTGNPQPITACIRGAGIRNLGLVGFLNGVKIGALNRSGCTPLNIENICAVDCVGWGVWLENCASGRISRVCAMNNLAGQIAIGTSTPRNVTWNFGNFFMEGLFALSGNDIRSFKVYFFARNGSNFNLVTGQEIEGQGRTGGGLTHTESLTLTNGSQDIATSDLSKWVVGSSVRFATTVGNVTALLTYFVVQLSAASGAGTIRISDRMGHAAITPNASGSASATTKGPGQLIFAGLDTNSDFTGWAIRGLGAEGGGFPDVLLQRVFDANFVLGFHSGNSPAFCARSCAPSTHVQSSKVITEIDIDSASQRMFFMGQRPTANPSGNNGIGVQYDSTRGEGELNLIGRLSPVLRQNSSRFGQLAVATRFVNSQKGDTATLNNPDEGNVFAYTTSGNGSFTLPTLSSANVGIPLFLSNPQVAGTLTVNTAAGQGVNNTGSTSFTVAPNSFRIAVGCAIGAGFYWAVTP